MREFSLLKKTLLICLCLILTAATVFAMTACEKDDPNDRDTPVTFTLKVVTLDGNETTKVIETKKWTVGAALSNSESGQSPPASTVFWMSASLRSALPRAASRHLRSLG